MVPCLVDRGRATAYRLTNTTISDYLHVEASSELLGTDGEGTNALVSEARRCLETIGRCGIVRVLRANNEGVRGKELVRQRRQRLPNRAPEDRRELRIDSE